MRRRYKLVMPSGTVRHFASEESAKKAFRRLGAYQTTNNRFGKPAALYEDIGGQWLRFYADIPNQNQTREERTVNQYATTPYDHFGKYADSIRRIDGELDYLAEQGLFSRKYDALEEERSKLVRQWRKGQ